MCYYCKSFWHVSPANMRKKMGSKLQQFWIEPPENMEINICGGNLHGSKMIQVRTLKPRRNPPKMAWQSTMGIRVFNPQYMENWRTFEIPVDSWKSTMFFMKIPWLHYTHPPWLHQISFPTQPKLFIKCHEIPTTLPITIKPSSTN